MKKKYYIIRLTIVLLLLVAFYSYMHNYTYRVLFIDKIFHGIPFLSYSDLDSLATTITISKVFDNLLHEYNKDLNGYYCTSIQFVFEVNRIKNEYRSVILFDFIDSVKNVSDTYYFSPTYNKVWHIDDYDKPVKGDVQFQFVSSKKYDIVVKTELKNAFVYFESCNDSTHTMYNIKVNLQKKFSNDLMSNISIYLKKNEQENELCFQRDTIL